MEDSTRIGQITDRGDYYFDRRFLGLGSKYDQWWVVFVYGTCKLLFLWWSTWIICVTLQGESEPRLTMLYNSLEMQSIYGYNILFCLILWFFSKRKPRGRWGRQQLVLNGGGYCFIITPLFSVSLLYDKLAHSDPYTRHEQDSATPLPPQTASGTYVSQALWKCLFSQRRNSLKTWGK